MFFVRRWENFHSFGLSFATSTSSCRQWAKLTNQFGNRSPNDSMVWWRRRCTTCRRRVENGGWRWMFVISLYNVTSSESWPSYCVVEIADGVAGSWTTTSNGVEGACSDACNLCPWWYKQKHYTSGDNRAYIRQEVTLQRKYKQVLRVRLEDAPGASWDACTQCVLGNLQYSQSVLYNRSHRKYIGIEVV